MSDVWTTQPIFGDGKWKLELVRTSRLQPSSGSVAGDKDDNDTPSASENASAPLSSSPISLDHANLAAHMLDGDGSGSGGGDEARTLSVLSVYLTSMVLDYSPADFAIPACIFLGLSPAARSPATRASRGGGFLWTTFETWEFARETEFWQCHGLPSLSALLEQHDIAALDAMELTVQISIGPRAAGSTPAMARGRPFEMEKLHAVPRDLVSGLEGLLDSQSTGDVVLLVRECGVLLPLVDDDGTGETWQREVQVLQMGAPLPPGATLVVRDRAIWAHSAILRVRSDFFRDMLASSFCEGQEHDLDAQHGQGAQQPQQQEGMATLGGRRVRVLRLPDADFSTAYAFLRFLYLDEVEFAAAEALHSGGLDESWLSHGLAAAVAGGEQGETSQTPMPLWEWRVWDESEEDLTAATTRCDAATQAGAERSTYGVASSMHAHAGSATARQQPAAHSSLGGHAASCGIGGAGPGTGEPNASSAAPVAETWPPRGALRLGGEWRRVSSYADAEVQRQQQQQAAAPQHLSHSASSLASNADIPTLSLGGLLFSDPHSHPPPSAAQAPPSALALYRLAHRCAATALADLARAHLVAALRPHNAFPLLLATGRYEELHVEVKRYVLRHWELVAATDVFDRSVRVLSLPPLPPPSSLNLKRESQAS
jgi:hypothetical protein